MAYTTINKSTDYFSTKLYVGNSGTNAITGVGFQPDMVWIKARSGTDAVVNHALFDAVRGTSKQLKPNQTNTELAVSGITSFDSDGFTLGSYIDANYNNNNNVAWNWKANGAGSSNTDGSITSTVSANTTSGFSIVKYTGTGVTGATVGHGLGAVPKMIIIKTINNSAEHWFVYHASLGNNKDLLLNLTNDATNTVTTWNNTTPTSTVWTMSNQSAINSTDGNDHIAYCFAEKTGYSKFGSYTGNGNDDGTFVYTGFKPAFVIFKNTSAAGDWTIQDSGRDTYNLADARLYANLNNAENDGTLGVDFLSNGIKIRTSSAGWNTSGNTYIYMAFAEAPLVGTNGVTAKAR
jgi:hypothetical protein